MEGKQVVGTVFGTVFKVAVLAVVIIFVYKYAVTSYDLGYRIFGEEPMSEAPGEDITVAIVEERSVKEIGKILEEKGLIRDGELFVIQEKVSSYKGQLKPGVYELNTSMTAEQMMEIMSAEQLEEAGNVNPLTVIEETEVGETETESQVQE